MYYNRYHYDRFFFFLLLKKPVPLKTLLCLPGEGKLGMEKFRVAAKANPWYKESKACDFFTPTYGLKPELVKEQLRSSIEVLG